MNFQRREVFVGLCLALSLATPLYLLVRSFAKVEATAISRSVSVAVPKPKLAGLDDALDQLKEPNAIDCGQVNLWTKRRASAEACAVAALKAKKPFRLRYQTYNRNQSRAVTIVGNRQGHVYFLTKIRGCCENFLIFTDAYLCKHPVVVKVNGETRIACKDRHNLTP